MSTPSIPDFRAALTRTFVPVTVSALLASWGAQLELFGVDGTLLTIIVTAVLTVPITMLYYAAVRALEWFKSSNWGWLLGLPKVPVYMSPDNSPTGAAVYVDALDDDDDEMDPDEQDVEVD